MNSKFRIRMGRTFGWFRARADREDGASLRIGRMGAFRGVQEESSRHTDRSWKSQSKRKRQWK